MSGIPDGALLLRPMEKEDLSALLQLARRGGRNVTHDEYDRFLGLEGARGYVVTQDGLLVGAGTGMRYYEHAFLGPLLLGETADATGVAIALLAQLIETFQTDGVHVIDAEAATAEEVILTRMGFHLVRRTVILERGAAPAPARMGSLAMGQEHLLDVGALDAEAVGYGRKQYLMALRDETPEGARVVEREGEVAGFVLIRRATRGYHLGPLVTRAGDADIARTLVRDALAAAGHEPVVALVPEDSRALPVLEAEGFRPVGDLARMRAGSADPPTTTATQWALGGRITG